MMVQASSEGGGVHLLRVVGSSSASSSSRRNVVNTAFTTKINVVHGSGDPNDDEPTTDLRAKWNEEVRFLYRQMTHARVPQQQQNQFLSIPMIVSSLDVSMVPWSRAGLSMLSLELSMPSSDTGRPTDSPVDNNNNNTDHTNNNDSQRPDDDRNKVGVQTTAEEEEDGILQGVVSVGVSTGLIIVSVVFLIAVSAVYYQMKRKAILLAALSESIGDELAVPTAI